MTEKTLRPGAVGVCESCGRSVIGAFVENGVHTATVVLGRKSYRCGGTVRPLWPGAV